MKWEVGPGRRGCRHDQKTNHHNTKKQPSSNRSRSCRTRDHHAPRQAYRGLLKRHRAFTSWCTAVLSVLLSYSPCLSAVSVCRSRDSSHDDCCGPPMADRSSACGQPPSICRSPYMRSNYRLTACTLSPAHTTRKDRTRGETALWSTSPHSLSLFPLKHRDFVFCRCGLYTGARAFFVHTTYCCCCCGCALRFF